MLADYALDNNSGDFIWQTNLHEDDIKELYRNNFWKEVLLMWSKFTYHNPKNICQIRNMPIWGNTFMRIDNQPIWNTKAISVGFTKVDQLLNPDNTLKNFVDIRNDSSTSVTFVQYYGICKSIPYYWRCILRIDTNLGKPYEFCYESPLKYQSLLTEVYHELVKRSALIVESTIAWEKATKMELSISEMEKEFAVIYSLTNIAKLRSFQYNILHQTLVLNEYVFQRRRRNTNLCTFCDVHTDTLSHFFWECQLVPTYWQDILEILPKVCYVSLYQIKLSCINVLLNKVHENRNNIVNFIILILKHNLYRSRCKNEKPNSQNLYGEVKTIKNFEKYNAMCNRMLHRHEKKWNNINITENVIGDNFIRDYIEGM